MSEEEKQKLNGLVQEEDVYGLMLLAVSQWVGAYHAKAIRAAIYVVESDDIEPTRIKIPISSVPSS